MKRSRLLLCATALSCASAGYAVAAPWERGFALDTYEPAFHYAGAGGTEDPGADCPRGPNGFYDIRAIAKTPWRTADDVEKLFIRATSVAPEGASQAGARPPGEAAAAAARPPGGAAPAAGANPGANPPAGPGGQRRRDPLMASDLAARGFAAGINTYVNPMAAVDEGLIEVTGKVAEGFDLDGDASTGDFVGVDGTAGVDNGLYRALGCTAPLRARPGKSMEAVLSNDHMRDGLHTVVVRLRGAQDPMNDSDVTVEIGYSPDDLVKDALSGASPKYSYRIVTEGSKYARFKGRIVDGVLETDSLPQISIPDWAFTESQTVQPLSLHIAKVRLVLQKDGTAVGLIGGYAKWEDFYKQSSWIGRQAGPGVRENHFRMNVVSNYYALRRNADGLPDATGRMTAISQAYRFSAVPAHVISPTQQIAYKADELDEGAKVEREAFQRAITTGRIQRASPPPPVQSAGSEPAAPAAPQTSASAPAAPAAAGS